MVYSGQHNWSVAFVFGKKTKLETEIHGGGVLYGFALICNTYYGLIQGTTLQEIIDLYLEVFISARNGLFVGFPLISIGVYLASNSNRTINRNCKFAILCLYIIEVLVARNVKSVDDNSLYLMSGPFAAVLLIQLTQTKLSISNEICKHLRKLSTGIYFLHRFILQILCLLAAHVSLPQYGIGMFFAVCLVSLTICELAYIQNRKVKSFLR